MIVPLTGQELHLVRLLIDTENTPDTLQRLRNVLVTMYSNGQISESAVDDLMSRLTGRYADNPELKALHGETCAMLRAAMATRRATMKPM